MTKNILKKKISEKIELLFFESLQVVDDFDIHDFSRDLLEHGRNEKNVLWRKFFFNKKIYCFFSQLI